MKQVPHLLVVEDHTDSLTMMALLLRTDGYLVEEADGCAAALALAHRHHLDLVLCDIQLTDGDGCELFQQLQAIYPVPGIAITAHAWKQNVRRYVEAGFKGHIFKPFEYALLRRKIEEVLRLKHLDSNRCREP